jgi:hypothetical protein
LRPIVAPEANDDVSATEMKELILNNTAIALTWKEEEGGDE